MFYYFEGLYLPLISYSSFDPFPGRMAEPPRLLTFVVSYDEKETGATVNKLIKVASKSSVFERAKDAFGLHGVCFY